MAFGFCASLDRKTVPRPGIRNRVCFDMSSLRTAGPVPADRVETRGKRALLYRSARFPCLVEGQQRETVLKTQAANVPEIRSDMKCES